MLARDLAVSVLLATRDRAERLDATLASIVAQQPVPGGVEVVVADNGSIDATPAVLARWARAAGVRSVVEPRPGKNRAMNRAVALARGRLLVFTDDDVDAHPGWLAALADAAARWPAHGVFGGRVTPAYPPETPPWFRTEPFSTVLFAEFAPAIPEGPMSITPFGPNFALRAQCLGERRFDEEIGPDGTRTYAMGAETSMLRALVRAGETPVYVPSAVVTHAVRPDQLSRSAVGPRAFRCGRGDARLVEWPAPRRLWLGVRPYLVRELATYAGRLGRALLRPPGAARDEAVDRARFDCCRVLGVMWEHHLSDRASARAAGVLAGSPRPA